MQKLQIYENLKVFGTKNLYYFFVQFNKTDFFKNKTTALNERSFYRYYNKKDFSVILNNFKQFRCYCRNKHLNTFA